MEDNRSIFEKKGVSSEAQRILWGIASSLFIGSFFPDFQKYLSALFPEKFSVIYIILKIFSPIFILTLAYWSTPNKWKIIVLVLGIFGVISFEYYYFFVLNGQNKHPELTYNRPDSVQNMPRNSKISSHVTIKPPIQNPRPNVEQKINQSSLKNEGLLIFADPINNIEWGILEKEYSETWDKCLYKLTSYNMQFQTNWRFPKIEELKKLTRVVRDDLIKNFGYWTTAETNSYTSEAYNPKTDRIESILKNNTRYLIMVRSDK